MLTVLCTCVFLNHGSLSYMFSSGNFIFSLLFVVVVVVCLFKESPYCSPSGCNNLHSHQKMQENSLFSTPSPAFIACRFFDDGHSDQGRLAPHCSFDLPFSCMDVRVGL